MNCPSFENLISYVDGEMAAAASQALATHLASGCATCASSRAWYESVKAIAASDDTKDAPRWVLHRALKLFETQPLRGSAVERFGHLIASLVFDSLRRPALAGARALAAADRQLLYRADNYSIDLQLAAGKERGAELTGQILREGEFQFESVSGLELKLVCEGRKILSTKTNKFGEFSLATLECGEYDLQIETDEISITIVGVPVA
jgi:hypothetical protein